MAQKLDPVPIAPQTPGISKKQSELAIGDRWIDGDKVRFVDGKPEKIGGWTKKTLTAVPNPIRGALSWRTLRLEPFIGIGTSQKLYVIDQGLEPFDITPLASTGSLTDPFSVTSGSATVIVEDEAHSRVVGDEVIYAGADAVGGIDPNGTWIVSAIIDEDNYQFTHTSEALVTATGGGTVNYSYVISVGAEDPTEGDGFGAGGYGLGDYGEPAEEGADAIIFEPRVWNLDRYGEKMLANPGSGGIYLFDPAATPAYQRPSAISNAPTACRFAFVTDERFIFACGVDNDPLNIKWPDQDDPTDWTPGAGNTANSRRVREGARLIAGKSIGNGLTGIWTDTALYQFQYTGSSFVYNSKLVGKNCGLVSPQALVERLGIAYWMSQRSYFYWGGGTPQEIPNVEDVREFVRRNLRMSGYEFKCNSYYNAKFNEIWWYYTTLVQTEPGCYVAVSLTDFSWICGTMERTSGISVHDSNQAPVLAAADGYLYDHENGLDADGAILRAFIKRAPMQLRNGAQLGEISGFIPDFQRQIGALSVQAQTYERVNAGVIERERAFFEPDEDLVDLRIGGRLVDIVIRSESLGGDFRMGAPMLEVMGSGARR